MPVRPPRLGYRSITPRLFVDDVAALANFLRTVFDAAGEVEPDRPTELRIGDSLVMVSSTAERQRFPAFLYVYVDNADEAFQRSPPVRHFSRSRSTPRTATGGRW